VTTVTLFNALTAESRGQERKVSRALELRFEADLSYMEEGIALMSIARGARPQFLDADPGPGKHMISASKRLPENRFDVGAVGSTHHEPGPRL
jgi:hypothetical protein